MRESEPELFRLFRLLRSALRLPRPPGSVRQMKKSKAGVQLVRRVSKKLIIKGHELFSAFPRVNDHATENTSKRMKPIGEGCRDPEVRSGASKRPEKIRVTLLTGGRRLAVGRNNVDGNQV